MYGDYFRVTYLFEILIIERNLGSSWLSDSWAVVWRLLISYRDKADFLQDVSQEQLT